MTIKTSQSSARKGHAAGPLNLAADFKGLRSTFLIANARLEFHLTHRKISPLRITLPAVVGNRERIAISHFVSGGRGFSPSINDLEPRSTPLAQLHPRKSFRCCRSSLLTTPATVKRPTSERPSYLSESRRSARITSHESQVTSFLIYCGAIRNPRKPLKT